MKNLNNYILEKLHITKNFNSFPFKVGMKFKCTIEKNKTFTIKDYIELYEGISDNEIKEFINKYKYEYWKDDNKLIDFIKSKIDKKEYILVLTDDSNLNDECIVVTWPNTYYYAYKQNNISEKLHVGTNLRRKKPTKKLSKDDLTEEIIVVCNQIYRKFMIQCYDMNYYNKYDHPIDRRDDDDMWYFKIIIEDVYNEGDDIFEYLKDSLEDVLDVEENITYNPNYSKRLHGREYKIFLYNPEHDETDK